MLQRRINFKNHENYLNQQNENYYKVRYYTLGRYRRKDA